MNLQHPAEIERREEGEGVKPVIYRIGVDVVQIQQQRTSGARRQLVQELGFGEFLVGVSEVVDVILQ